MPGRRSPASPVSPNVGSPTEEGKLTDKQIRDRIRQGREKRREELEKENAPKPAEAEVEKEKELAAEREELVGGVQKAINFIIGLVFVSMPLSEDNIDWFLVGFFVFVNLVWNLFFHQNTTIHISILLLLNFTSAQYSEHLKKLPALMVTVDPVYYAAFTGANGVLGALGYFFYINKKPKKSDERESRLDHVLLVLMVLNFFALVALGAITPQQITNTLRMCWMAITNLSING